MGKIVDLARECKARTTCMGWDHTESLFYEIESQIETLRMENQAQHLNVQALTQEIRDLKGKKPEPDLQRGDFVSYIDRGKKFWGVFHHLSSSGQVWAYWQNDEGNFPSYRGYMPRDRVTFEFRPEK